VNVLSFAFPEEALAEAFASNEKPLHGGSATVEFDPHVEDAPEGPAGFGHYVFPEEGGEAH
jgi:hypothetical protein